jgi:immune inhibitor A
VEGEIPVLVVAVQFSDRQATVTLDGIDAMVSGEQAGSVNHFCEEVSYGLLRLTASRPQQAWHTSAHTMAHYGEDAYPGVDNANGYISELAREALRLADPDVDYASLDANGNGRLDVGEVHIVVVHAGPDQANTHHADDIWSHRWWIWGSPYGLPDTYLDGVLVSEPNLQGNEASPGYVLVSEEDPVGVIAHELFHSLGAPDLYDPNDQGVYIVGGWCLMGRGVWNGSPAGTMPAHPCSYIKMDINADPADGLNGWITPEPLVVAGTYSLDQLASSSTGSMYLASIPGDNEYFVLENRLRTGYDGSLPGQGVLIFHIDEDMPNFNQDWDPLFPRVSLEDPGGDSRKRTAAFSVESGYTEFTPETDPGSESNDGEESSVSVTDIGSVGEQTTFVFGTPGYVPPTTTLVSCYPNPFDEECTFLLAVGEDAAGPGGSAAVTLDVYDILGRKLARAWEGSLAGGNHTLTWDGRDLRGRKAPAGLYVAVARVRNVIARRRLLRVPRPQR